MKKVAIIGTAGVPGKYGGFETLVHHVVPHINEEFDLTVYCTKKLYSKSERVKHWNKARLHYLPFNANGAQSVIYDIVSITHAIFTHDVLLILGVSGGVILPFVRFFTSKVIIVNIDGLEWKRAKWNKPVRHFLKLSERLAVRYSHANITDNIALQRYTAKEYNSQSHLIEYGANHVKRVEMQEVDFSAYAYVKDYLEANAGRYAMSVCRIEPENNIHIILEAFARTEDTPLVLVGNWQNSDYGKELFSTYSDYSNITLYNPIYEQSILDQIRCNCKCYIHGHSAGGTNPSLIEAMYLGLPVIAFHVIYNKETTEFQAKYFDNIDNLQNILRTISVNKLEAIGATLKAIAERRYTWEIIANHYASLIGMTHQDSGEE